MITSSYQKNLARAEKLAEITSIIQQQLDKTIDFPRVQKYWQKTIPVLDVKILAEALTYTVTFSKHQEKQRIGWKETPILESSAPDTDLIKTLHTAIIQQKYGLTDLVSARAYWETQLPLLTNEQIIRTMINI